MTKVISASEAKTRLGSVMDWAVDNNEEVIVESRGEPKVAIISFAEYEQYTMLKEQERRRAVLAKLEALALSVQARNQDLSEAEAEAIADRFSREVIEEMVDEGKIAFQKPPGG